MFDRTVLDLGDTDSWNHPAPVRKLVYMVLLLGVMEEATEIHFEPHVDSFQIFLRVDGRLIEGCPPPRSLGHNVTNVLKVLADLDIVRKKIVQRGFIHARVGEHEIDFVVTARPTAFGDRVLVDVLAPAGCLPEIRQALADSVDRRRAAATQSEPIG